MVKIGPLISRFLDMKAENELTKSPAIPLQSDKSKIDSCHDL